MATVMVLKKASIHGESVVVILSTHIVEDVADLCPQMAIMAGGRILANGAPNQLVGELEGKLWRTLVHRGTPLDAFESVVSTRRVAGQLEIRMLANAQPEGAEAAAPTLEDFYFATLHAHGHSTLEI